MSAADRYDVVVLGSGTGGKLVARAMVKKESERQSSNANSSADPV